MFTYEAEGDSYHCREVPDHPHIMEHTFYIRGDKMPADVPRGCNPRQQNIFKPTYKKVAASYCDTSDMTFLLKNKGITVLADSVTVRAVNGRVFIDAKIPDELGNVDGHHTYEIIMANRDLNPAQKVSVKILERLPNTLIPAVAAGLNTSVQVTTATMADHSGLFAEVHEVLRTEEYHSWIGWRDNQENTSAGPRDIVGLMWVCNPLLFTDVNRNRHPSWIYTQGTTVYEKGFYDGKNEALRKEMLKIVRVLPEIIDLFCFINETVEEYCPRQRKKKSSVSQDDLDADGHRTSELTTRDMCVTETGRPFRDPSDKEKYFQLRSAYRMMMISSVRSLLVEDPRTHYLKWRTHPRNLRTIIKATLRGNYKSIVRSLRSAHSKHNECSRQPALWDLVASVTQEELNKFLAAEALAKAQSGFAFVE